MGEQTPQEEEQPKPISWWAVFWSCVMLIGVGYSNQQFPTLHDDIKIAFKDHENSDRFEFFFALSQSITLCLMIIFCTVVGMLCDAYSTGAVMVCQTFLVLAGQFGIVCALIWNNFTLLLCSRVLLYLSGCTMLVSVKVFINNMVHNETKGFIFGLQATFSGITKGFNLLLDPMITMSKGVVTSAQVSFYLMCVSFIGSIFCYYLEEEAIRRISGGDQKYALQLDSPNQREKKQQINPDDAVKTLNNSNGNQQQQQQIAVLQKKPTFTEEIDEKIADLSHCEQVRQFDRLYWLFNFIISAALILSTIQDTISPAFISQFWMYSTIDATRTSSIFKFIGILMPFFGLMIDKYHTMQFEFLIIACLLNTLGIVFLTTFNPILGCIIFGLGYNFRITLMFPLLNKVVPAYAFGKALGIIKSCENILDSMVFLAISFMVHHTGSYESSYILASVIGIFMTIGSVVLHQLKK